MSGWVFDKMFKKIHSKNFCSIANYKYFKSYYAIELGAAVWRSGEKYMLRRDFSEFCRDFSEFSFLNSHFSSKKIIKGDSGENFNQKWKFEMKKKKMRDSVNMHNA